ncbi:kinesin heavy chain [Spatholobus suberectus]|nr:kinesin heavy chain [Spatholobus suberectus]
MAFHLSFRSQSVSNSIQGSSLVERISEEPLPLPSKSAQSTVTCIYQAHVAGYWRNVSVLWCKNLMNHYHTLNLKVDSTRGDFSYTCKIDVKPWYFWNKKGYKSFEVDGHQVEVYWDLRSARFARRMPRAEQRLLRGIGVR